MRCRLPVLPIADLLGSGEATLLRRLLAEAQRIGPRPASSVNAFCVGGVAGALPREITDADVSALNRRMHLRWRRGGRGGAVEPARRGVNAMHTTPRVPVILLTRFLGIGKTTQLNRLLAGASTANAWR